MAIHCTWEGKEENCSELFATEATDNGYCCSFNSIILSRNSSDNVTQHKSIFLNLKIRIYIVLRVDFVSVNIKLNRLRYAKNSGVDAGLSVILDAEVDDYNVTSALFTGFKVCINDIIFSKTTSQQS